MIIALPQPTVFRRHRDRVADYVAVLRVQLPRGQLLRGRRRAELPGGALALAQNGMRISAALEEQIRREGEKRLLKCSPIQA